MIATTSFLVQAGNTDHKLTQLEWSRLTRAVTHLVGKLALKLDGHVRGEWYSLPNVAFQNACWHLEVPAVHADSARARLHSGLCTLTRFFKQDSIAVTEGTTALIGSAGVHA